MRPNSLKRRSGQTMVEYIIIVALVAICGLAVWRIFGGTLNKKMTGIISSLDEEKGNEAKSAADEIDIRTLDEDGVTN